MSEHITTDSIERALRRTDLTKGDLRTALAAVQSDVEDYWPEWMDLIESGDVEVVADDGSVLVLADRAGYNWDEETEAVVDEDVVLQRAVEQAHRDEARRLTDVDFDAVDAFAVGKPATAEAGQQLVEAIVNGLCRRGLSPGQAWAYYGVSIRGNSRNAWAKRMGYHNHSAVSESVRKAESKLQ